MKATILTGKYKDVQGEIVEENGGQYRVAVNGHVFTYARHSLRLQSTQEAEQEWPPCLNAKACNKKLRGRCHYVVIGPPWHCTQYTPDGEYNPQVAGLRCPEFPCKGEIELIPTGWRWARCQACGYEAALMRFQTKQAITPLQGGE